MKRVLADKLFEEVAFAVTEAYESRMRINALERMLQDASPDLYFVYMNKLPETRRQHETGNAQLVARLDRLKHLLDTENSFFT